jgi:hypothetical protein
MIIPHNTRAKVFAEARANVERLFIITHHADERCANRCEKFRLEGGRNGIFSGGCGGRQVAKNTYIYVRRKMQVVK